MIYLKKEKTNSYTKQQNNKLNEVHACSRAAECNSFCVRVETHSAQLDRPASWDEAMLPVTEHDVRRMFKSVNIKEPAGLGGLTRCVWKASTGCLEPSSISSSHSASLPPASTIP